MRLCALGVPNSSRPATPCSTSVPVIAIPMGAGAPRRLIGRSSPVPRRVPRPARPRLVSRPGPEPREHMRLVHRPADTPPWGVSFARMPGTSPGSLRTRASLVQVDLAIRVDGDDESLFGLDRAHLRTRQAHIDAALHDRSGDHEDDQQHERDVHQRRDIDIGVEGQFAMPAKTSPAQQSTRHQIRPSRASVPTISCAKPSSSPANRPSRLTYRLYAMTAGTATARPPTVVTKASATPGATAVKASITPSTVPRSPSSGLTEPKVASHGMKRAAVSRSAPTSFASTMRNASSWVVVNVVAAAAAAAGLVATPVPFRLPGFSSEKKCTASRSKRL